MTPQEKYERANIKRYVLKLNISTDKKMIQKLESVNNKQGYLKELIRKDIEEEKKMTKFRFYELNYGDGNSSDVAYFTNENSAVNAAYEFVYHLSAKEKNTHFMSFCVREVEIEKLPRTDEELKNWIDRLYDGDEENDGYDPSIGFKDGTIIYDSDLNLKKIEWFSIESHDKDGSITPYDDEYLTLEEARDTVKMYQEQDEAEGDEAFYRIRNNTGDIIE